VDSFRAEINRNVATVNPQQPKVFGAKFRLKEVRRIFLIELRNFKLWKMPKLLTLRFLEEWYLLNFDNTELKRSTIIFSVSERHRLGGSGLIILYIFHTLTIVGQNQ